MAHQIIGRITGRIGPWRKRKAFSDRTGVFVRFSELEIKHGAGHSGDALPSVVNRVDSAYTQGKGAPDPEIGPGSTKWASE